MRDKTIFSPTVRIGLKLLASVSFTELLIMVVFNLVHIENLLPPSLITVIDVLTLSVVTYVLILYWVVNPMKTLTVLKEAENSLRAAAYEWRNTFDSMKDGVMLLDSEGKVLRSNRSIAELLGKQFEEINGHQCREAVQGTSDAGKACPFGLMMQSQKRESVVLSLGERWFEASATPSFDSSGNITGAVHIMTDITERKRYEETLRASEEMHRLIFQGSPVGIFHYDVNLIITDCNDRFVDLLKTEREKLVGLDMHTLRDQRVLPSMKMALSGKENRYEGAYKATASFAEIWVSMRTAPLLDLEGVVKGGVGIVEDISERKYVEDRLKASEEKFRTLFESANDSLFILDLNGNIIDTNLDGYEHRGYTKEELLTKHISEIDSPESAAKAPEHVAQIKKLGKAVFEASHVKKDGAVFPVEVNARVIDFEGRKVIFSIVRDVSERKKIEGQLSQITREWEETFNTITDMVTVHDKDFNIIRANKAAEKILGLPFLSENKVKCFEYFHGTACPPGGCPSCQSLITGGPSISEMFEPHLNRYIEIQAIPRLDSNNQIAGLIHVVRDISERKKAEDVLKEEKNKAQTYLDIAGVMIVALDAGGRITLINKKGLELIGYEEREIIGQSWFDLCIPAPMREEVRGVFNELMTSGIISAEYYENPIKTKDGSERILAFHNVVVRTESGEITGVLSSGEDITEQKWAHDQLNQRVHHAALGADVGVALTRGGDLRVTLQLCAEAMTQHLNAAFARIWTFNERERVLELQASAGMYTHINGAHGRVPVGKFKIGLIAAERKPHLTNQVIGDPRVGDQEWAKKEGMVAFAGYPLIVQDRLVGVMAMFSRSRVPEATMSSLGSVADVIALGIERKNNEVSLETYSKELSSLNIASNSLMLIMNLKDIYQETCNVIYSVFDVKMIWLGIIDEKTFDVRPVAFAGKEDGYLSNIKVTWDNSPFGMGPTGMAIKSKKTYKENTTDTAFAPWYSEATKRGYNVVVSVPIVYERDKCVGALNLYSDNQDYFTVDRLKLFQIFANQAAIAIENAKLIEGLEVKIAERTEDLEETNIELQTINRELKLRREEAESGSRSKSDFLANMSHELRTPLNAVIGLSQVLLEQTFGPLNAKQSEYLDGVKQSGNHLLELINEILDLSKIEAGKEEFEPAVFLMTDALKNAFMMVREKAMKHGIELFQDFGPEVGLFYADERRVKQVLFNLLSNAVKFTEPGGKVGLEAHQDERALTITVWDTGVGIPENKRNLIFQPFQQLDSSLSKKYEGTGLGLVLSKRLVEMHGGTITFGPREGGGTNFMIALPVLSHTQTMVPPHTGQAQTPPREERGQVVGKKIMIAEDNQLNMLLAADFLKGQSFIIVEAASGEIALEKAALEKPDVILLDIQMPGIDGFEVIRRLKGNSALNHIPVIAMTALAMKGDEELCLRAGFDDYISKPINLREMLNKIERRLERENKQE